MFSSNQSVASFLTVERKYRFAVVGLGRAGHFHLQSLSRLADRIEIAWVVDVIEEVSKKIGAIFRCKSTTSIDEALADPTLDAVIVCSTTFMHYEHIMKSFAAKKAVFAEKPISHNPAELREVIDVAINNKVPFMVGFQRRCDASFMTLKQQLQKHIGNPRVIRSTSRDNPEPSMAYLKISGGIFHDMLVHDFDMIYFLTGQVPESVYSVAHAYNPEIAAMDDVDTVLVTFKYASGLIATADTSRIAEYGYDQRLEVFGDKGMTSTRNMEQNLVVTGLKDGFHTPPIAHSFPQRYPEAYFNEICNFVELLQNGGTLPADDLKWLLTLEQVCTAAELSWRLNRPVKLAEVEELRDSIQHHGNRQ